MFFCTFILHHKHNMLLNMAWRATTLGPKSIKDVKNCNISKLCKFILQFIQSESNDPRKRFSLRLSTMLVHGVVLIWREQVIILEKEITDLILLKNKETERLTSILREMNGRIEATIPVKKRKKGTKKAVLIETPPSLVLIEETKQKQADIEQLPRQIVTEQDLDVGIAQARIDEITLKDVSSPKTQLQQIGDFGGLNGAFQSETSTPKEPAPQPPSTITVDVLVHAQAEIPEQVSTVQPVEPLVQAEVPQQEVSPHEEIAVQPVEITPKELPVRPRSPEQQVLETLKEKTVEEEADILKTVKARAAKNITIADKLWYKPRTRKFVAINTWNRLFKDEGPFEEIINTLTRVLSFKPLTEFWPDSDQVQIRKGKTDAEARGSDISDLPSSYLRSIGTPTISSLSKQSLGLSGISGRLRASTPKRLASPERTVIDEMPPAANGITRTPIKRRRFASVVRVEEVEQFKVPEPPMEIFEELPSVVPLPEVIPERIPELEQPITSPEQRKQKRSPPRQKFGAKWSTEIMKIVNDHSIIKPVDICKELNERLTKMNMSVIFATLLTLAKEKYVILRPAPQSIELDLVEKGPRSFF